jgi:hypothetical protein
MMPTYYISSVDRVAGIGGFSDESEELRNSFCSSCYRNVLLEIANHSKSLYTTQMYDTKVAQLLGDNSVDDKTGDYIRFPEGGWQAWMTIVGAYVNDA